MKKLRPIVSWLPFPVFLCLVCILCGYAEDGFSQTTDAAPSATVQRIMTIALSRCYSEVNGIKKMSFVPATNEEVAEVKALGEEAVAPLARYLDLKPRSDFQRLFAVKFLENVSGTSTLGPLQRAFAQNQWEVTRLVAVNAMFAVSEAEAKPYVEKALGDNSQVVRQRAQDLWVSYQDK